MPLSVRPSPRWWALAGALVVGLAGSPGGVAAAEPWRWSSSELKKIQALERRAQRDGERWVVEAPTWRVEAEADARFAAEAALYVEAFTAAFTKITKKFGRPRVARRPTLVVLSSEERYREQFNDGTRGFYRYKYDGDGAFTELHVYTYIEADKGADFSAFYRPILQHEGTHVLLRRLLDEEACPKWLDEGFATFFQFWDLRAKDKQNIANYDAVSAFTKHLPAAAPGLAPLLELETTEQWNPDQMGPQAQEHYALGGNLIAFLLGHKARQRSLSAVVQRAMAGERPLLKPEEIKELDRVWIEHVAQVVSERK